MADGTQEVTTIEAQNPQPLRDLLRPLAGGNQDRYLLGIGGAQNRNDLVDAHVPSQGEGSRDQPRRQTLKPGVQFEQIGATDEQRPVYEPGLNQPYRNRVGRIAKLNDE